MTWKKGQSGNPGGRVGVPAEVRELAQRLAPEALEKLAELMRGDDPRTAAAACNAILDRALGKPIAPVEVGRPGEFDHLSDEEMRAEIVSQAEQLGIPLDVLEALLESPERVQ